MGILPGEVGDPVDPYPLLPRLEDESNLDLLVEPDFAAITYPTKYESCSKVRN